MASYSTGLWGNDRIDIGAFYFDPLVGHIGAFYFGPLSASVSADSIVSTYELLAPTVSIVEPVSASILIQPIVEEYTLLQPSIIANSDITIDFIGTPRSGFSPLVVDFEAIVTFGGSYQDKYIVSEYKWYFDYGNYPLVYETTTTTSATHVYRGYAGQTFDVRLEVTVQPK